MVTLAPVLPAPDGSVSFAPIGLTGMLNPGGAVRAARWAEGGGAGGGPQLTLTVLGCGSLLAYCSAQPRRVFVGGAPAGWTWDESHRLQVTVPRDPDAGTATMVLAF